MPIGFSRKYAHKFAVAPQNKKIIGIIIIWRNGRFVPSPKNHVYYIFYAFNISLVSYDFDHYGADQSTKFGVVIP